MTPHSRLSARGMPPGMHRPLRWLLIAGSLWFLIEAGLFWLCVQSIGVFPTLFILTAKGLAGLALMATVVRGIVRDIVRSGFRQGFSKISGSSLAAIGALLLLVPGFVSTFAGLALFSPSLRAAALRRFAGRREKRPQDATITLEASEWREISARRPRRKAANRSITT